MGNDTGSSGGFYRGLFTNKNALAEDQASQADRDKTVQDAAKAKAAKAAKADATSSAETPGFYGLYGPPTKSAPKSSPKPAPKTAPK